MYNCQFGAERSESSADVRGTLSFLRSVSHRENGGNGERNYNFGSVRWKKRETDLLEARADVSHSLSVSGGRGYVHVPRIYVYIRVHSRRRRAKFRYSAAELQRS